MGEVKVQNNVMITDIIFWYVSKWLQLFVRASNKKAEYR